MPPKIDPIQITLPVFTGPISYACEILVNNDFSKDRSLEVINKRISDIEVENSTKSFYLEVKKYIETSIIKIG